MQIKQKSEKLALCKKKTCLSLFDRFGLNINPIPENKIVEICGRKMV